MAKKAKPSQEKPASGKSPAPKTVPIKAAPSKARGESAKTPKAGAKSAINKTARSKGPKIVAGENTRAEVAVAAITTPETPAEAPPLTLQQRYASFEDARSATIDALLESIEQAEHQLTIAKQAANFAELEQVVGGRQV